MTVVRLARHCSFDRRRKDFEAVSGSLTFAAGETVKRIAVPIYGDLRAEAGETFLMPLSVPGAAPQTGDRHDH